MIREVEKIKAVPMPQHLRAHSVQPARMAKTSTRKHTVPGLSLASEPDNLSQSIDSPQQS